ncbi:hypothetical protein ABIC22_002474 [Paenibacillus sp. PvP094]|uniref:glycosyltransferase n=1 Tax=Paenibacillus sp. PvP094 TaxID=3156394 RepID=UPI003396BF3C
MNDFEWEQLLQWIQEGNVEQAVFKLYEIYEDVSNNPDHHSNENKHRFYKFFGEVLFESGEYHRAISMFKIAQSLEFSEEIDYLIQQAFIEPNIPEFEMNYIENLKVLKLPVDGKEFSELLYYLIPTEVENQYYFYNKKTKEINDAFTLFETKASCYKKNEFDSFSSFLYVEKFEIGNSLSAVSSIAKEQRECFVLIEEEDKFLATLQGGCNAQLKHLTLFLSYHSMKSFFELRTNYIPRNIISFSTEIKKSQEYIQYIHNYRRTSLSKNRENVLLSICIPSYNRGHRALENVIHLLSSSYDYELEVVVSNNGSQNDTSCFYSEIEACTDSRITYTELHKNEGFYGNLVNVCKKATGKFLLLLSDEDSVDLITLEKIISFLRSEPDLAIVKSSTTKQSKFEEIVTSPGTESIYQFMLTSNYMSGIIFNKEILVEKQVIEKVETIHLSGNEATLHYPHMCWELLMCEYGAVYSTSLQLVNEGIPEKMEAENIKIINKRGEVSQYATIESRLEQHRGFFEVINSMEISNDEEIMGKMYKKLCDKTFWLIYISLEYFYKKFTSQEELLEIIDEVHRYCSDSHYLKHFSDHNEVMRSNGVWRENLKKYVLQLS